MAADQVLQVVLAKVNQAQVADGRPEVQPDSFLVRLIRARLEAQPLRCEPVLQMGTGQL